MAPDSQGQSRKVGQKQGQPRLVAAGILVSLATGGAQDKAEDGKR